MLGLFVFSWLRRPPNSALFLQISLSQAPRATQRCDCAETTHLQRAYCQVIQITGRRPDLPYVPIWKYLVLMFSQPALKLSFNRPDKDLDRPGPDDESTLPHLPFGCFWLRLKKEKKKISNRMKKTLISLVVISYCLNSLKIPYENGQVSVMGRPTSLSLSRSAEPAGLTIL